MKLVFVIPLALLSVFAFVPAASAQDEPPPPLLDEFEPPPPPDKPEADPPRRPPDQRPVFEPEDDGQPLPEPDPLIQEAPFWEHNPLMATLAGGVGAGIGAGIAVGATWGLTIGLGNLNNSSGAVLGSLTLLLGVTAIPFIAGFGAGGAVIPLSPDCTPGQFGELCEACLWGWACVGCALGGGGGVGYNCGNLVSGPWGNDSELRGRSEVYWAAIGAGLGTVAGAGVGFLTTVEGGGINQGLLLASVGAVVGATAGGAGGAAIGSLVNGWGFDDPPPPRRRRR